MMAANSSMNCGNYSSGTFHITQYLGSYEVGQVADASLCALSHSPTKCNTMVHDGYYSNSSLNKQNHNVIEEGLLYVLVLWMMAQEACNYSAQATLCLPNSPECHKNLLLNSTLFKIHFTFLPFYTKLFRWSPIRLSD
jgi:hypothetical protein